MTIKWPFKGVVIDSRERLFIFEFAARQTHPFHQCSASQNIYFSFFCSLLFFSFRNSPPQIHGRAFHFFLTTSQHRGTQETKKYWLIGSVKHCNTKFTHGSNRNAATSASVFRPFNIRGLSTFEKLYQCWQRSLPLPYHSPFFFSFLFLWTDSYQTIRRCTPHLKKSVLD